MRDLATIDAEIAATRGRIEELRVEREAAFTQKSRDRAAHHDAIIKAFDDGASRDQIVAAFGVTYSMVNSLLNRRGRSERQRREARLEPSARTHYDKLRRRGIASRVAAQIAETVAS